MSCTLFAGIFSDQVGNQTALRAMPLLLTVLVILAIAYRYYSAFLAAKVAVLDDSRLTPAHTLHDGQNYHATNKWVLFGHHFAAISGAGPLIGPVLAIQYGYMPGLLWLLIGVCLAGAVQDMLVLAASVRRNGKSLAEIARNELGPWANVIVSAAILFIVVIALAGLGFVVVKALGGEEVKLPVGMQIKLPADGSAAEQFTSSVDYDTIEGTCDFPENCQIRYRSDGPWTTRPEKFSIHGRSTSVSGPRPLLKTEADGKVIYQVADRATVVQLVPGSSWGTFTIACTIPIALFVGLYMYKLRKGRVLEGSLIGAVLVLAATIAGNWIPGSPLENWFSLSKGQTVLALTTYGFIASVLPVWLLLCPRDYLSSFLKIGTIILLVLGVLFANPVLPCPMVNHVFASGGPTFPWGGVFPFVFICIMCGSISGFHSLVASGTTPKMIDKESHIRPIGYGAMLIEGLVGVVALIAAASLDTKLYYEINVDLTKTAEYQERLDKLYKDLGQGGNDPLLQVGSDLQHLNVGNVRKANLGDVEKMVGNESLRGRTGGAVTLAVGMALIFTEAFERFDMHIEGMMKYWYHFAIMFEALFILTTIDTGTRIARFLLQETLGKIHPQLEKPDWIPGAVLSTLIVTVGWGALVQTGSIDTIWPMFGIANQLLAVIALCIITTLLINSGRAKYALVTLLPMLFVLTTTMTAGGLMVNNFVKMIQGNEERGIAPQPLRGTLNLSLTLFVMVAVALLLVLAVGRWLAVLGGMVKVKDGNGPSTPPVEG
jgi:carbon starvation protein